MSDIISYITSLVSSFGYYGIFIAAFVETIFPPIPSEVIFPLAGFVSFKSNFNYLQTFLMSFSGALGATIGSIIIYILSYKIGRKAIIKIGKYVFVSQKKIEKAEYWFQKYGTYAVFLGRMAPGIREIISIPAGISKMDFKKFVIFTFAGSLIWSTLLVFAGYYFGNSWESFSTSLQKVFPIITLLLLLLVIAISLIYFLLKKRKKVMHS
jgi:membrane protein DedA with SNARE-associated domain